MERYSRQLHIKGEVTMNRKDYILFDLDGTLTDPKEGITKSVQHALEHFGRQMIWIA